MRNSIIAFIFLSIGIASATAQQPSGTLSRKHVLGSFVRNYREYPESTRDLKTLLHDLESSRENLKTGSSTDLPGKTEVYTWPDTSWIKEKTITTVYNVAGHALSELWDMVVGNDQKIFFTYNANNDLTERLFQVVNNGIWKDSIRERWQYSSHNDLSFYVYESIVEGSWVISEGYKMDLEYSGNLLTREVYYVYDTIASAWNLAERYTYSYTNGKLTGEILEVYKDGTWVLDSRYSDFKDAQGRVDSSYIETWSGTAWVKGAMEKFIYTGQYGIGITMYQWDTVGKTYLPTDKWFQDYNSRRGLISLTWEVWTGTEWILMIGYRVTETLSGQRVVMRITELYSFDWFSGSDGKWENTVKEVYSDFIKLGTDPLIAAPPGILCYPNPAGSQTAVSFTLPNNGDVVLVVYSLTGQKVFEQSFSTGSSNFLYQLNLDKVPPGTYLLTAVDSRGKLIGKTRLVRN